MNVGGVRAAAPVLPSGHWVGQHVFVQDRVRIEVALEARKRYKYVQPRVLREGAGWTVLSPNCSRNIHPDGAEISIAWLVPVRSMAAAETSPTTAATPKAAAAGAAAQDADPTTAWLLHGRDHAQHTWVPKFHAATLDLALERLVSDPLREFWQ